jgi:hypothetical protein
MAILGPNGWPWPWLDVAGHERGVAPGETIRALAAR